MANKNQLPDRPPRTREFVLLALFLIGLVVFVYLARADERAKLSVQAAEAARKQGFKHVKFRTVEVTRRIAIACGRVDGRPAVFGRDRKLLLADENVSGAERFTRNCADF